MCFLTLADEDGLFDVSLFPAVHRRSRGGIAGAGVGPFLVEGKVEDRYGALSITASRVVPLGALPRRSGSAQGERSRA